MIAIDHYSRSLGVSKHGEPIDVTQQSAAVKKHLTVLADGGLITTRIAGRARYNALNPTGMAPIRDWLTFFDTFWDDRLSALKSAIEKDTS